MILILFTFGIVLGVFGLVGFSVMGQYIPQPLRFKLALIYFDMAAKNLKRIIFMSKGGGLNLVSSKFNNELLAEEVKLGKNKNYYSDSYGIKNPFLNIGIKQYPVSICDQKFSFVFSPVLLAYSEKIKAHVSSGKNFHLFKRVIENDTTNENRKGDPTGKRGKKETEAVEEEEKAPDQPDEDREIQGVCAHVMISKNPGLVDLSACESLLMASGESSLPELLKRYVKLSQTGYSNIDLIKTTGSVLISFGAGIGILYLCKLVTNPAAGEYITEVTLWASF